MVSCQKTASIKPVNNTTTLSKTTQDKLLFVASDTSNVPLGEITIGLNSDSLDASNGVFTYSIHDPWVNTNAKVLYALNIPIGVHYYKIIRPSGNTIEYFGKIKISSVDTMIIITTN